MKRLIINADDFGLLPEVNEGIVTCFAAGSLSSTTLMVNGGAVEEAAALVQDMPGLKVGLHFTLTCGRPVSDASAVPSLVEGDGRFFSRSLFERRMVLDTIRSSDVEREFQAQVRAFEALGLRMSHVDSHQHVHLFPLVLALLLQLVLAYRNI